MLPPPRLSWIFTSFYTWPNGFFLMNSSLKVAPWTGLSGSKKNPRSASDRSSGELTAKQPTVLGALESQVWEQVSMLNAQRQPPPREIRPHYKGWGGWAPEIPMITVHLLNLFFAGEKGFHPSFGRVSHLNLYWREVTVLPAGKHFAYQVAWWPRLGLGWCFFHTFYYQLGVLSLDLPPNSTVKNEAVGFRFSTNIAPEKLPGPNRKESSSNHRFSGVLTRC